MALQLSNQELNQLEESATKVLVVRHPRTKRKFVVLSEAAYERARPLIEFVATQVDVEQTDKSDNGNWTEEQNARRIALIEKKYRHKLTAAEQQELERLQERAYQHRDRVAPVRNEVLKLVLEALERRPRQEHKPT